MPFINVKIVGEPLRPDQVGRIQRDITGLMADVLHKVGPLVGVLVEQVAPGSWSIGGAAVTHAVQADAIVSAGSNSAEQKARFIAEAQALLRKCPRAGSGRGDVYRDP